MAINSQTPGDVRHHPYVPNRGNIYSDDELKSVAKYLVQKGRTKVSFQESIARLVSDDPKIRRKEKNRLYQVISRDKLDPAQIHEQMQATAASTHKVVSDLIAAFAAPPVVPPTQAEAVLLLGLSRE